MRCPPSVTKRETASEANDFERTKDRKDEGERRLEGIEKHLRGKIEEKEEGETKENQVWSKRASVRSQDEGLDVRLSRIFHVVLVLFFDQLDLSRGTHRVSNFFFSLSD